MSATINGLRCGLWVPGRGQCKKGAVTKIRELCDRHDYALKRYGDPLMARNTFGWPDNFYGQLQVQVGGDWCIYWDGPPVKNNYGRVQGPDGENISTHHLAYELYVGPIPDGLVVDHICHDPDICKWPPGESWRCPHRKCVAPWHLKLTTPEANVRRSKRSVCGNGHPQTPENVYTDPRGWTHCRPCNAERMKDYRLRKRER